VEKTSEADFRGNTLPKAGKPLDQRDTFPLFDRIFKFLMRLSGRAVVSFINGLFGTNHSLDSVVSYPSTETINPALRQSLADMVITINHHYSYIIEAQISGGRDMGVRILQYILGEAQRTVSHENPVTLIRLPDVRVIYWEVDGGIPDKEIIIFEFPGGARHRLEVPSFKFPRYSPAELEAMGLGILLPFCLLRLRRDLKGVEKGGGRPRFGERIAELLREARAAAEQSEGRGIISQGDLLTVLRLLERLQDELYGGYTEELKEPEMWENIELINYNEVIEKQAALLYEERVAREKEQAIREKAQAAQKLRELGVSDEVLAAAGLAIPRREA
jgi:hypothetical protein